MAEYGKSIVETNSIQRTPPIKVFGIVFGEESYLDYPPNTKLKVPQNDLLVFFRQMAVMLKSGVPLSQGLELLAENMTNKEFGACIFDISKKLNSGEELSSCLNSYPRIFAPITIGLIEAGEAGGILSEVLDRLALLLEAQSKIKGQITGALIYPIAILVLAVTISLALLIFIVPTFDEMFKGMGAELPALTGFMLTLSKFVTSPTFAIGAPIIIFIVLYLFKTSYASQQGREFFDRLILKVPLFGDLILKSELASMSDTLSTLINSGIPLVEGLERCINASNNEIIKIALRRAISLVTQGQELSVSLSNAKVIPRLLISMIKIGEETGALSFMLENLSNFYKREVEEAVTVLTKAMEPMVIFVVAAIVGTIVISLYLPMFDLINQMG
ncbi:type II secretion system F family protein [Prochlorococcus marinus]|uniref:Type II secretory pathway n=1 Tax=Prochlorococcus marinus str. GP2 TaxID=59925 RepID=A0A0A1ZHH0_PROMR|nr:type II secretion system F family protein [Prochlorococcus marinus]KGF87639.1 Type II secretory pathway [Prochlorococcus marinus str. GP2]